jgi:hypothetical protein
MATITNSLNNDSNFFTSGTGFTATTGDITATLGDLVITNGYVVLGTAKGNSGDVLTSQGSSSVPIWAPASGSGFTWAAASADASLVNGHGVINTKAGSILTMTLPSTAAVGTVIGIQGSAAGAFGWTIVENTGQNIQFGNTSTTITSGSLTSTNNNDACTLICTVADTTWNVNTSIGNITIV